MNAYARLTALENAIKSRILLYSEQLFADMTEDSMFLNELYYLLGKREELFQELGYSKSEAGGTEMKKILKLKAVLYEDHQISCRAVFGGANAAETGAALCTLVSNVAEHIFPDTEAQKQFIYDVSRALREVQDERGDIEA